MKRLWIIALLFWLVVIATMCFAQESKHCDSRAQLVQDYMYSRFGNKDSDLDVWVNRDYGPEGKLRLERRENRFEHIAEWANKLPEPDRSAYLGVIQDYEDGAKQAYSEWHTHTLQRTQAEYDKHLKECAEEERKSKEQKPLPKPPEDGKP